MTRFRSMLFIALVFSVPSVAALSLESCAKRIDATAEAGGMTPVNGSVAVPVSPSIGEGVGVITDPETGCQYLEMYGRSLTPRMEQTVAGNRVKGCH